MNTATGDWMSGLLIWMYLCWCAGSVLPILWRLFRHGWLRRTPFGRAALLRIPMEKIRLVGLLPALAGFLIGGSVLVLLKGRLMLWQVAALVAIGLALEELREPRAMAALPGVVRFLENYRSAAASGHDLYGALAAAGEDLPPGPVSLAVETALEQQIHHRSNEVVFGGIGRTSPFLQEAVLALKANGWKVTGSMEASLGMIQKRAGHALDQAGVRRLFFTKTSPLRIFFQALISGCLLVAMFIHPWMGFGVDRFQVASLWLIGAATAVLLHFFVAQAGLRRLAAGGILVFGLVTYINSIPPVTRVEASAPTTIPTFTETATRLPPSPSPTSTVTPTVTFTPRPVIKQGIPPVSLPANTKPEKRPRLYPPVWIETQPGR